MFAQKGVLLLLVTVLVDQSNGGYPFSSYFKGGFPCPVLTNCNKSCPKQKSILGCESCECRPDLCKNYPCANGHHCQSEMKISWFFFDIPHCVLGPDPRIVSPTVRLTTTSTSTTTTQRPVMKEVCEHGDALSTCDSKRSCKDPTQHKCVLLNIETGDGVCCRKYPKIITNRPRTEQPRCLQEPIVGPCRGLIYRYFYNTTTQQCQKFVYGGCRENENNFEDMESCRKTCENPCMMRPMAGMCKAAINRYYYNTTTEKCEKFFFGGCQGNGNNFITIRECEQRCDANYNKFYMSNEIDKKDRQ